MKGYKIDFTNNTVTITKAFEERAGIINSTEYTTLRMLQLEGFTVVRKTHATPKSTKPKPTYAQMEHYLRMVENSEFYTEQYKLVCEEAKSHNNSISKVRKWFNATFPNYGKLPEFDENNRIIVTPKDHDAKTLKIAS